MADEYIDVETCSGLVKSIINVFVIVKAVILIAVSLRAIVWFCKSNYRSFVIISLLMLSIVLVISEVIYRFTDANLRFRFI